MVTASLRDLPSDAYRVRWSTLSSDDLHRTSGFFVFGVGTAVTAAGFQRARSTAGSQSGLRWVLLLGLALALGSSLVVGWSALPGTDGRRGAAVRRLVCAGAGGAHVGALGGRCSSWTSEHGRPVRARPVRSGYAERWALRELGLALFRSASSRPPRVARRSPIPPGRGALASPPSVAPGSATQGPTREGGDPGRGHGGAPGGRAQLGGSRGVPRGDHAPGRGEARGRWPLGARRPSSSLRESCGPLPGHGGGHRALPDQLDGRDRRRCSAHDLRADVAGEDGPGRPAGARGPREPPRLRGPHDLDLPRRSVRAEAVDGAARAGGHGRAHQRPAGHRARSSSAAEATAGPLSERRGGPARAVDVAPALPGLNVVSVDVFDTRRPAPGEVTAVSLTRRRGRRRRRTALGDGRWSVAGLDLSAGTPELAFGDPPGPACPTRRSGPPWSAGPVVPAHRPPLGLAGSGPGPSGGLRRAVAARGGPGALLWDACRAQQRPGRPARRSASVVDPVRRSSSTSKRGTPPEQGARPAPRPPRGPRART